MIEFAAALGHGPEGATPPRTPVALDPTRSDRVRAWLWHRWGIGHRPQPRFATEPGSRGRSTRRR